MRDAFHCEVEITSILPKGTCAFGVCKLDGGDVFLGVNLCKHLPDMRVGDEYEMRIRPSINPRSKTAYEAMGVANPQVEMAMASFAEMDDKMHELRQQLTAARQRILELEELYAPDTGA